MRFDLTDEQKALRDTLDAFFAARFGGAEGVDAVADTALDRALWTDISALGLGGILVPAAAGGLDMGLLTLAVAAETLGRYAVPAPVLAGALAAWAIAEGGSEAQRERWLGPLMSGEALAAIALEGETLVERADAADLVIVGMRGGGLALVTAFTATAVDTLDRTRPLFEIDHDDAEPLGGALADRLLDALLILHAADALGAAGAAQARAIDYARERRQFGRAIGSFQALKHQLADMSVELEPARPLCWYAAHAWDTGRADARRAAALAKAHLGEISVNCARAAVEAHGGIGYTWEYPVHLFLKRAMHDRSVHGTPNVHRERAAALAGW
ncbi:MAG TPA: acyl-CoA dehydrogenase family protein [Allosphingosinicella sp.]|nr:acyl-CoA dehydrogenase family protein [Allosphingosinicella sp.]